MRKERRRKTRVELTIQQKLDICSSIGAMKPESVVAREYGVSLSTVYKIAEKKKELLELVKLGYGRAYQYHPPRENRDFYMAGARTMTAMREALVGVTKQMMFHFFGTFDHFNQLTENGKEKFWQRFCRFANVTHRRVNGCTQLIPTDADERIRDFFELMTLMSASRNGYTVTLTGDETGVVREPAVNTTLEIRGTSRVRVRTLGTERQMTTAFLAARSV